jgi:hypothetical protein
MTRRRKFQIKDPVTIAIITLIGTLFTVIGGIFVAKIGQGSTPTPVPTVAFLPVQYVGRVFNNATIMPIPNAEITLEIPGMMPRIAYTDSAGAYSYTLALTGQTDGKLRVNANGFDMYSRNISISPGSVSFEEIHLSPIQAVEASVEPVVTAIIALEPTSTLTPEPTEPPVVEAPTEGTNELIQLIDNYYRCFNKPDPQNSDLLECWNMLSNYPGEIRQNLEAKGGFDVFSTYWKPKKVTYILYLCSKNGKDYVDAEYYIYQRSDLSVPFGPFFLEYEFALGDDGWRIKGAAEKTEISSYCESEPRIKNISLR